MVGKGPLNPSSNHSLGDTKNVCTEIVSFTKECFKEKEVEEKEREIKKYMLNFRIETT